jgi:hypothetical protein
MRVAIVIAIATICLTGAASAQSSNESSVPRVIGNRANGFSYQPTPSEVVPREEAEGLRPSRMSQEQVNRELEKIDRDLLREEGASTSSVPNLSSH